MLSALSVAEKARYLASPNPMVGAVIVKDNEIIGTGFTHKPGKDHAEIDAIKNVYNKFKDTAANRLKNSSIYVTLEPCGKQGRTPACTKSIIKEGIKEVYIGCKDPSQKGVEKLKKAGLKVKSGLLENESLELNRGFFSRINRKRPFVTCKIACSLDGGIGLKTGGNKWITSKESREDVHKLRANADAILTGIETVLADNPKLTVRNKEFKKLGKGIHPKRYVLDSKLRLKGNENLLTDGLETTIFCHKLKKVDYQNSQIKIVEASGKSNRVSLKKVMDYLNKEECNHLMVEAGSKVNTSFIASKLIDELIFYVAPTTLGKNKINFSEFESSFSNIGTIHLELKEINEIGPDIKLVTKPIYS